MDAGCRIDPPVSEPSVAAARSAAIALLEPPEDPPGTREVSQGFLLTPKAEFSVDEPIANSSMFVLPRMTAPSASSLATAVAVKGER